MEQRAQRALIGAAVGVIMLVVVNYAAFHIGPVQRLDADVFNGFGTLRNQSGINSLATFVAELCNPQPYIYLCLVPVAIALYRRRPEVAVAIVVVLVAANETTELLKPLLGQTRPTSLIVGQPPGSGSWPSGHATAAMSLALCMVLAVAPRYRGRTAVLGAAFALAVTYSFLTLGWHYPSDAVGGFLIATTWTFLGVAGLSTYQSRRPAPSSRSVEPADLEHELLPIAGGVVGAAALVATMVLVRPASFSVYAHDHERFLVGMVVIASCAMLMASWLLLVLRRSATRR